MQKKCDYFTEKGKKYWCILKNEEIGDDTYKTYCYYDETKKCPLYQYYTDIKNK